MKVVFLDRDGVINEYPGDRNYVTCWDEFHFIPTSIEAIKLLKKHGYKIFVVSNQAGVAKGLYSKDDLDYITDNMLKSIRSRGADLDGVYYCTHRDEDNCSCRKPKPGLINKALGVLGEKPAVCFFIGDSFRDMKAAKAAGCKGVLVFSGKEKLENRGNWEFEPDYVFGDILEAARYLCSKYPDIVIS